jgi:hypothetical protein
VWLDKWASQAALVERSLTVHALRLAINYPDVINEDDLFFTAPDPTFCTAHNAIEVSSHLASWAELLFREEMQSQKAGRYARDWEDRYISRLVGATEDPLGMARRFWYAAAQVRELDDLEESFSRRIKPASETIWETISRDWLNARTKDSFARAFCMRRAIMLLAAPLAAAAERIEKGFGDPIAAIRSASPLPDPKLIRPAMHCAAHLVARLESCNGEIVIPARTQSGDADKIAAEERAEAFRRRWQGGRGKKQAATLQGIDLSALERVEKRARARKCRAHKTGVNGAL